ncbi:hypothetical protein N431DRAFT_227037 [Stipitochalara longipes BDJ]|nr:hypothetical protein N431DRAFT_227037 [Stipitochalara longipes BDJ]
MASITSTDVEILVHTTAPSRGQDDARYRALTRAYMGFHPETHRQLRGESTSDETDVFGGQAQSQLQGELLQSTQEERESAASYRPDEEEDASTGRRTSMQSENLELSSHAQSLMQSPMVSFNSVIDNIDSPVFRGLVARDEQSSRRVHSQDSSDSWRRPPSSIADSQPENERPVPVFTSPSRILELYLPKRDGADEPSPELGIREYGEYDSNIGSTSTNREPLSDSFERSRLPSSPSPNKRPRQDADPDSASRSHEHPATQDPKLGMKRKWPESSSAEIRTSSAPSKAMDHSVMPSNEPCSSMPTSPRKRQRTANPTSENIGIISSMPSSQIVQIIKSSPPSTERLSAWSNVLELRPVPPATSTAELNPEMFITEHMHQLASKMPAGRLFRPVAQSRDLRPLERGYWSLNCESWDDGLRNRCWNYLGDRIARNLLGWGVWCVRDAEHLTIRVYCWGIIVDYIYLLLYLASEGKSKKIGASWIGGDGEAIIKMPS